MVKITEKIEDIVKQELERAVQKHGIHNSPHEAIAVIQEEYEEACDELDGVQACLSSMWKHVKADANILHDMEQIYKYAVCLAAEAVQVAAMAKKEVRNGGN